MKYFILSLVIVGMIGCGRSSTESALIDSTANRITGLAMKNTKIRDFIFQKFKLYDTLFNKCTSKGYRMMDQHATPAELQLVSDSINYYVGALTATKECIDILNQ